MSTTQQGGYSAAARVLPGSALVPHSMFQGEKEQPGSMYTVTRHNKLEIEDKIELGNKGGGVFADAMTSAAVTRAELACRDWEVGSKLLQVGIRGQVACGLQPPRASFLANRPPPVSGRRSNLGLRILQRGRTPAWNHQNLISHWQPWTQADRTPTMSAVRAIYHNGIYGGLEKRNSRQSNPLASDGFVACQDGKYGKRNGRAHQHTLHCLRDIRDQMGVNDPKWWFLEGKTHTDMPYRTSKVNEGGDIANIYSPYQCIRFKSLS
ncbi:hypothetical protein GGX14DRAFT_675773 [Mycena pura]|uniref:Uncharacterized protein n=1 Tax=Mycena pura TaxID=153505 RepID=A0AAD6YK15_9AGAR|nr:hypothetical protein GGX14DRAFT_675773 [Mycena pura]